MPDAAIRCSERGYLSAVFRISLTDGLVMFSIIIPTFNYAHFLRDALASVKNQSTDDYEVIVVDDGSTDDTPTLLSELQWPKMRYLCQTRQGQGAARNAGIAEAHGDHLIFLDADDQFLPGALQSFQAAIDEFPNHHLYIGGRQIYDNGKTKKENSLQPISQNHEKNFARYLSGQLKLCQGRFAVKRECLIDYNYPKNLRNGEDAALFAHLLARYSLVSFPEPVVRITKHQTSQRHALSAINDGGLAQINALFDATKLPPWAMAYKGQYHAQWLISLSKLHAQQGDTATARRLYGQAIRLAPKSLLRARHWRWMIC